jgi:hypothetical protein
VKFTNAALSERVYKGETLIILTGVIAADSLRLLKIAEYQ